MHAMSAPVPKPVGAAHGRPKPRPVERGDKSSRPGRHFLSILPGHTQHRSLRQYARRKATGEVRLRDGEVPKRRVAELGGGLLHLPGIARHVGGFGKEGHLHGPGKPVQNAREGRETVVLLIRGEKPEHLPLDLHHGNEGAVLSLDGAPLHGPRIHERVKRAPGRGRQLA